jgi:hypothetical protein
MGHMGLCIWLGSWGIFYVYVLTTAPDAWRYNGYRSLICVIFQDML